MAVACRQRHIYVIPYSCGPNRVHNVEPCFPWLCQGKLGLSNTSFPGKTLSFAKPPQRGSSFAAFRIVLDGIGLPGKGNEEPFRVPSITCSALFRQFRQKSRPTGPRGPVPIQQEPVSTGSFPLFPLCSLG